MIDGPDAAPPRKRDPEPGSLADRMRTDPYPAFAAPRLALSGLLKRNANSLNKARGAVIGAAVGDAASQSHDTGSFGLVTAASILEAHVFLGAPDLDGPTMTAAFRRAFYNELVVRNVGRLSLTESQVVARCSFSVARWSSSNLPGSVAAGRLFAGLSADTSEAAKDARALLHLVLKIAIAGSNVVDPFQLFPYQGSGPNTDFLLEQLQTTDPDPLRDAIDMRTGGVLHEPASAYGCIAQAFRAYRTSSDFEACIATAQEIAPGDASIAAIAGLMAGGTYGLRAIPVHLLDKLSGSAGGEAVDAESLLALCDRVLAVDT